MPHFWKFWKFSNLKIFRKFSIFKNWKFLKNFQTCRLRRLFKISKIVDFQKSTIFDFWGQKQLKQSSSSYIFKNIGRVWKCAAENCDLDESSTIFSKNQRFFENCPQNQIFSLKCRRGLGAKLKICDFQKNRQNPLKQVSRGYDANASPKSWNSGRLTTWKFQRKSARLATGRGRARIFRLIAELGTGLHFAFCKMVPSRFRCDFWGPKTAEAKAFGDF